MKCPSTILGIEILIEYGHSMCPYKKIVNA